MPTDAARPPLVCWLGGAYWRWTHADLFTKNPPPAFVRVTPASVTTACLGMIASIYLDLTFRRFRLSGVVRPLIAGINSVAATVDGSSARLREPAPGTLFANFTVVAEVAR